jgi:quinolinate synthase
MVTSMKTVRERILDLKKERNALLLSHYYENGQIQDLADHVGDSLALAQWSERAENPVILVAGVVFMGESAKILSPQKTVLVPDLDAGCSLVQHSPFARYLRWRQQYPEAICVSYVNSSAEVKAITDVCVTSSNAEKIIRSIPANRSILFGPDRNLGRFLSKKMDREMILWPGACEVHILFSARRLFELKTSHPQAVVLAHPECDEPVLDYADVIGSTARLLEEVITNPAKDFIVATEEGILHQMRKARPDAKFVQAPAQGSCACNECPYMKLNTLEKIERSLTTLKPEIVLPPEIMERARVPLERMLAVTRGEPVTWPQTFNG